MLLSVVILTDFVAKATKKLKILFGSLAVYILSTYAPSNVLPIIPLSNTNVTRKSVT